MLRKYWRRITVDDAVYRWMIQHKPFYKGADTFQRLILVRSIAYPTSQCIFISDEKGYFSLMGDQEHSLVVTPKLAAACIRYARQQGWNPQEHTQDIQIIITKDLLMELTNPSMQRS